MTETTPVELKEDRIPVQGIETTVGELVELYGGEMKASRDRARDFVLPLRRGVATAGGVECTLSWSSAEGEGTVTMQCNRDVDSPRIQRILMLIAGAVGALMFMLWPFFPNEKGYGALAWLGGVVAIAVYLMTLRKSSGGLAFDFLQRLAKRQRELAQS